MQLTAPAAGDGRGRSHRQILIAEPSALKALDGQNIVISPAPGNIQYLKGAQWADRLPRVVQARLAETFQRSGEFKGVGKPGEGLGDRLSGHRRNPRLRGAGRRQRKGRGRAVRAPAQRSQRRGSRGKDFYRDSSGAGEGNDAYVGALDGAFGQAAVEIVDWTGSDHLIAFVIGRPAPLLGAMGSSGGIFKTKKGGITPAPSAPETLDDLQSTNSAIKSMEGTDQPKEAYGRSA